MQISRPKLLSTIGFLTVMEDSQHGLVGGYLVLNPAGRPMEFHCTAPVKPNRAQEILYGPTLQGYLYGEQIGQTLVKKAKANPQLVCTDVDPVLAVREFISPPVVLLAPEGGETTCGAVSDVSRSNPPGGSWVVGKLQCFSLGSHTVATDARYDTDQQLVTERWAAYREAIDLSEPFDRIRQAIEEAQRR